MSRCREGCPRVAAGLSCRAGGKRRQRQCGRGMGPMFGEHARRHLRQHFGRIGEIALHCFGARWLGEGAAPAPVRGEARCLQAPAELPDAVRHVDEVLQLWRGPMCVGRFAPVSAAVAIRIERRIRWFIAIPIR